MFLFGTELDYVKSIVGSNFEIKNPNAKSSCGCGISVNFDMEKIGYAPWRSMKHPKTYVKKIRDGECPYKVIDKVPEKVRISWFSQYLNFIGLSYKYVKNVEEKEKLSFPPDIVIDSFKSD